MKINVLLFTVICLADFGCVDYGLPPVLVRRIAIGLTGIVGILLIVTWRRRGKEYYGMGAGCTIQIT